MRTFTHIETVIVIVRVAREGEVKDYTAVKFSCAVSHISMK